MADDRHGPSSVPPSFSPRSQPLRPANDDAQVVGRQNPPAPPRASARRPAQPVRPATSSGAPPSIQPGSRPSRPAAPVVRTGGPATRVDIAPVSSSATRPSAPNPRQDTSSPRRASSNTRQMPGRPATGSPSGAAGAPAAPRRRHRVRAVVVALVVLLVVALAWPVGLAIWANGLIQHTDALSGAPATPGTTYLLVGSDARGGGGIPEDGAEGVRTDTILLLHKPASGPTALISLPRDTYVEIDGHGPAKLNAAYAYGGAPLLVHTVEQLTGLTVDTYAEIGLGGVARVVDAVGGVELCYDRDVNDPESQMVWTAGCHDVDGAAALPFVRMRKADPEGDIGRAARQRQLIQAVMGTVNPTSLVWHPSRQVSLIRAGTGALTVDEDANIVDLAKLALAFRAANGAGGVTGTPPIANLDYRPGDIGSTVLLDPAASPGFWASIRDGELPPGPVGGWPTS